MYKAWYLVGIAHKLVDNNGFLLRVVYWPEDRYVDEV